MSEPTALERVAAVLRRRWLAEGAVLLAALLVGVAVGQLAGIARVGAAWPVLPVLAVVSLAVAAVLIGGWIGAGSGRTPYW